MTSSDLLGLVLLLAAAAGLVLTIVVALLLHALLRPPRKTYATALGRDLPTDPGQLGLPFEDVTFSLEGGAATPGWIVTGEKSDAITLVTVHGYADSRYGILNRLPLLAPHVERFVLYDLRGHGESEAPNAHCGITDVHDLIGILDQANVTGPVVLFGYSMGAGIAIAAAAFADRTHHPDRTWYPAGVIADGPYRHWDEPIRCYFRAHRYPVWPVIPITGLLLDRFMPGFGDFDRAGHARQLQCPLLVLHGEDDWLCPLHSARDIADAAPDARLVTFPGGGHLDLADIDEATYRNQIADFLDRAAHAAPPQRTR